MEQVCVDMPSLTTHHVGQKVLELGGKCRGCGF